MMGLSSYLAIGTVLWACKSTKYSRKGSPAVSGWFFSTSPLQGLAGAEVARPHSSWVEGQGEKETEAEGMLQSLVKENIHCLQHSDLFTVHSC